jgi:hypothetical protein
MERARPSTSSFDHAAIRAGGRTVFAFAEGFRERTSTS